MLHARFSQPIFLISAINLGGLIESKSYGIGTTHGSPYRDRISNEILQLQENGFLDKLYRKWWKERNLRVGCDDTDFDHRKKSFTNELDLKNIGKNVVDLFSRKSHSKCLRCLGGIFVMLIIGLSFSFIVTSMEFYFKAKRRRVLDGVTYFNTSTFNPLPCADLF